jgi:ParB-like chromosome segregation protein Spo0J
MDIEIRQITEIRPYENNPRQNDAAVDAVAASIREFGFRQPIVVDTEGVIICGHTRYKAALKLGLTEVPVHVAKDLTPAQIKAYRIADNKSAELADWNYELLPIELSELKGMDFDLGLLGFSSDELAELLDTGIKDGLTDPDEIPEPPDEAITKPGDLWILGDHRLLCGDSSKPEDVDRLLAGATIQLVNTDPPYNVAVAPRTNNAWAAGERRGMPRPELAEAFGGWDLKEEAEGGKPQTDKKMRARDRVLANDFISDEEFALYCDVIVQRYEQFTGKKAERESVVVVEQAETVQ